jgi:hypothetical protein
MTIILDAIVIFCSGFSLGTVLALYFNAYRYEECSNKKIQYTKKQIGFICDFDKREK